jgi:hypothetical protein
MRIEACRILPLFAQFRTSTTSYFNFLDRLVPLVSHDEKGVVIQCLLNKRSLV